jgi:RND superfamily putative drug exporter
MEMALSLSPNALTRGSARHPWRAVAFWVVLFVVSFGLISGLLSDALTTDATFTNNPESKQGSNLLEDRLQGPEKAHEALIIQSSSQTVDDQAFRAEVERISAALGSLGPGVIEESTDFYASQNDALVSKDRHSTLIPITMAGSLDDAQENIDDVEAIVDKSNGNSDFKFFISGTSSIGHDFQTASEEDLARGESIGGVIALIILVLVLGALVSAVVPIVMAVMAIVAALGMTALLGTSFEFSFFVTNMITMMGLAVGIDYSLFVLSRFREERQKDKDVLEAVDIASSTAGRAVFFSGLTVIIALVGMFIIPSTIFRSIAAGAIIVVSFAILASLTLLPALIRLLGDKVNRLRIPLVTKAQKAYDEEKQGGLWDKISSTVMRYPVVGVVVVVGVLAAAAIPYFSLNSGLSGVSSFPDGFQSKQGFEILASDFQGGQVSPTEIVIDGDANSPAVTSAVESLKQAIAGDSVFGPATYQTNPAGDLGLLSIQMTIDPNLDEAMNSVTRLRDNYVPQAFDGVPAKVYVTGTSAENLDASSVTSDYTPVIFFFVLALSFILLMLVFRSIVVPATAILMNLLSVGAAYGLLVLVSQKGVGADILGFQQVDTIEFWLPLFLFSVLFGLSMDYHVFLLSRIRERYDQTHDNTDAVAYGLRSTGRLITGAALIMVAVFGGFAMGQLVMLQQVGFGLGVAVLIDATIIRSILVPATMKLLGDRNWYLPSVLGWLPHLGIEGHEEPQSRPRQAFEPEGIGGSGS